MVGGMVSIIAPGPIGCACSTGPVYTFVRSEDGDNNSILLHHNRKTLLKNTIPSHYRRPDVQDLAQAYNSNRYAVVEFNDFG